MTIKELKTKWNKEKEHYRKQEIGTGVHSFIRDFLESEDLFNLQQGSLSAKGESRKKEYIHEHKAKEKRQADFVIYINSDIVIPIEAECFGNIEAGAKQLFNYQKDFEKQYGILTDSYIWRFYNNNVYREFNLDQIFGGKEQFQEFWKEYIKSESYYLTFFEPQGQLSLLQEAEKLPVEQNREVFFNDITKRIKSFKNKLQIEGYFTDLDKKEREKKAIEITYAYLIQFILYKTLVDNDFGHFKQEFDETVEKIHEYLKAKRYKDILGIIDGISTEISKDIYKPFAKEQEFINRKLLELYHKIENKLSDVSPWLDIFVFIKKYDFSNIENEIFGYIYENYLKELYEEEQKGQYFTDPAIANFMLHQVGFTPETIKRKHNNDKDSISLIDPSCGSGTFLYGAVNALVKTFGNHDLEKSKKVEEIVNQNIFGLDIAEFPLYLAEMNIVMRMLPQIISEKYNNPVDKKIKVFKTNDSIAEFIDENLDNTINDYDIAFGQQKLFFAKKKELGYQSFMREEKDLEEMIASMHPPRKKFDYVVGNPPYISYNECAKQKVLIFELMKKGKARLNNIYGVNLHSTPNNSKKYRPNPNLYAFFISLGLALLKDCGKLCFIIPQTILTAGDLDVIRFHLAKHTTIEKIISFSGKMFVGRGLKQNKPVATSSLIFIVSKESPALIHQVEIINYKNPNDTIEQTLANILVKRNISSKKIMQIKLLKNVQNWNFIKQSKKVLDFYNEYLRLADDITYYYSHNLAQEKFRSKFFFDSGYDIDEKQLLTQRPVGEEYYSYPKLDNNYLVRNYRGFWINSRAGNSSKVIKLRQANQGYNLLDSKYKVLWSYANPNKFHFTETPLIWARNQICAIGSSNKKEIIYLFALLNSRIIKLALISNLKNENEKDLLISTTSIKEFVRIPVITEDNQPIKSEIIKQAEAMLILENYILSNFVDFSKIMIQKFDDVSVEGDEITLEKDKEKIRIPIKSDKNLIVKVINEKYGSKGLKLEKEKINLEDLKALPVIDFEQQKQLKNYIDDLVFALYFNIPIKHLGLSRVKEIKDLCSRNSYYKIVEGAK